MRVAWVAFALGLSACTPFEGDRSGEAFAPAALEEAFPGARVQGQGEAVVEANDGDITIPFVIQEGMAVAGGDMILGPADAFLQRSTGLRNTWNRWDTCSIPYAFDSSLSAAAREDFLDAVDHWEEHTGLSFVEDASASDRIHVRGGSGCSSYVGKIGGAQALTLSPTCGRGAAIHEIGHAMGFFHEQARSDRDEHVTVHMNRVQSGREHNFRTWEQRGQAGMDIGPYDVGSIMHYGSWAFATGSCWSGNTSGCTITHLDGSYITENQRNGLSSGDLAGIQELYGQCGAAASDDHGDTLDEATVVNGPMQVNGQLDRGDHDVFAIHAPAGHFVTVYTSGTTDTVGDLYRDGSFVASDDTTGDGPNFELSFVATDSAHHVDVKGWTAATHGAYTLHVETEAPDTGDDHGDALGQATVLTGSTSVQGILDHDDEDYFLLDVPEGSQVTIGTAGSTDTVGDLIVDGVVVATDDTTGEGPNFQLAFTVGAGAHHVRVKGWRPTSTGAYTLNVDVVAPASGDDHGDTEATATWTSLQPGADAQIAGILDPGDTDVFRIQVGAAGALSAFTTGSTDTYGTLYDGAGNVLDENDDTSGLQFAVTADVQPGTYYLFVRGYSTSTTGPYQLDVTLE